MNNLVMKSTSDKHTSNSLELLMINVCLDWNCIIGLEEEREYSPALRQIREWYKHGKIKLCISSPSRLENPKPSPDDPYPTAIDEAEWEKKMTGIGLEGIELRPARSRSYNPPLMTFDFSLDLLIMRKIHDLLFPKIDFSYDDYCRRKNVEPIVIHGFLNLTEAYQAASKKQRRVHRNWNNAKCDALSLNAFSTWSEPDDIFVTGDGDFGKEKLKEPFVIERRILAPPSGTPWPSEEPVSLIEQTQTIRLSGVIKGQIMTPQEAEKYLRKRLEE